MMSADQVQEKLALQGYVKEGIYDISYHRMLVIEDEAFCFFIKEHEYSFGIRYTIIAHAVSEIENEQEMATLLQTAVGRGTLARHILARANAKYPSSENDRTKAVKISLNWLEPDSIGTGIDQIELRLVEGIRTVLVRKEDES